MTSWSSDLNGWPGLEMKGEGTVAVDVIQRPRLKLGIVGFVPLVPRWTIQITCNHTPSRIEYQP
jgi:hypothetical protein